MIILKIKIDYKGLNKKIFLQKSFKGQIKNVEINLLWKLSRKETLLVQKCVINIMQIPSPWKLV